MRGERSCGGGFWGLLCAVVLLWPLGPARAQGSAEHDSTIIRLSNEGIEHFKAGRFKEAIRVFERAYDLEPDPNLLFNIGRCYQSSGNPEEAISYYQRFVSHPSTPEADRAKANRRIETLRARLNARTREDGPATQKAGAGAPLEASSKSAPPRAPRRSRSRVLEWSLIGAGAGLTVIGGIFGGLALSAQSSFESAKTVPDKQAYDDQAKSRALLCDVGVGVGIATLTTGVVLFFVRKDEARPESSQAALLPIISPRQAGVALQTRF